MKKLLFFLSLALILPLVGCGGDDDEPKPTATLNVKELTDYVGKTPDFVKANFKSGTLDNEGGSLGKTTLYYSLPTNDVNYSVTFKGNTAGVITDIDVYGKYASHSKGIELYKSEMDKINSTIPHVSYIARYNNGVTMDFTNRTEFWDYVAENNVSKFIQETWWIENTATIKFDVEATYTRNSNAISIEIERKEW